MAHARHMHINQRVTELRANDIQVRNNIVINGGLQVDTIVEKTDATGINIDGVLLKNGSIGVPKSEIIIDGDEGVAVGPDHGYSPSLYITDPVIAESEFTFVGPVKFQDKVEGFLTLVTCHACDQKEMPGFEWGDDIKKSLCMNCIFDCSMQFKAKESWAQQNGDPMRALLDRVTALEKKLADMKVKEKSEETPKESWETIYQMNDRKFDSSNYTQYF
jgi:hypothetical protein